MSFPVWQICSHVVRACIFQACDWFSRCQSLRFPPLPFVPPLSGSAFSTAAIIKVSSCQVTRFQPPHHMGHKPYRPNPYRPETNSAISISAKLFACSKKSPFRPQVRPYRSNQNRPQTNSTTSTSVTLFQLEKGLFRPHNNISQIKIGHRQI